MAEKLWHWGALGDVLNRTSNGQKLGVMGTKSPVHTPANAAPARDPPELHRLPKTYVCYTKQRVMCGRSSWWGPFIFLHAIRRMKGPAFHCLLVQTSLSRHKMFELSRMTQVLLSSVCGDKNLYCMHRCSCQGRRVRKKESV